MSHSSRRRTVLAVTATSLVCASPAAAQAPVAPPPPAQLPPTTVTVTGTGTVVPKPLNRKSSASIAAAVAKARAAAAPLAVADGTARATRLATLNGLTLGKLLAITEGTPNQTPFIIVGPYGGQEGTFGPGKYCGTIRRTIFKTDRSGKRKRVGTRSTHTCRVPASVSVSYGMTFSTTPPA